MNTYQLSGKWNQIKSRIKQKYTNVTDEDLHYTKGKFHEILGRLRKKTGKTESALREEINRYDLS